MKKLSIFGLLLVLLGVSITCLAAKSWKEEVLLHDGKKIVVKRSAQLGGFPTLESRERKTLSHTITFTVPGAGRKVVWEMNFRNDVPEPNGVNVFLLDIVNGIPFVAGYPAGCIAYNKWKRPNPPQILFKFDGNQWKRITLAEFPPELSRANVIVGGPSTDGIKSFYSVEQVNAQNHDITEIAYKSVVRSPLTPGPGVEGVVTCPDYNSKQYRSFKAPVPLKSAAEK